MVLNGSLSASFFVTVQ